MVVYVIGTEMLGGHFYRRPTRDRKTKLSVRKRRAVSVRRVLRL